MPTLHRSTSNLNWKAGSLRLTVFLTPLVSQVKGEGWWAAITGNEPETRTAKPGLGQLVDVGPLGDNSLTLSIQTGRIDWFLGPSQSKVQDEVVEVMSVGDFPEVTDSFLAPMNKWLELCPPILRLAYGAVLLEPVESKEGGYQRLAENLPSVKIDADGSEDFFYQINRPRQLQVGGRTMRINRLSKWSVASYQHASFAIGSGISYQHLSPEKVLARRLELDISTPAGEDELPHETLGATLEELMILGLEIAEKGDIP